ncbi:MAG: 4Fe-4S binding protein [Brevefilum sp.]
MDKLKERLSLLIAVLEAWIRPSGTVEYPYCELHLPDGFRGALTVDPEKCTGCGLCVRDCPANGLELIKKSRDEFRLIHHPARCAYCGQCEDSCRRGAISHTNQLVSPVEDPAGYVVVLHEQKEEKEE